MRTSIQDMAALALVTLLTAWTAAQAQGEMPPPPNHAPKASFGFFVNYVETSEGEGRILVKKLVADGPAQAAGLLPGDLISAFGGETFRFRNLADFYRSAWQFEPGEPIVLDIVRGDAPLKLTVVPEQMNEEQRAAFATFAERFDARCAQGDCSAPEDCGEAREVQDQNPGLMLVYRHVQSTGRPVNLMIEKNAAGALQFSSADLKLPPSFQISDLPSLARKIHRPSTAAPYLPESTALDANFAPQHTASMPASRNAASALYLQASTTPRYEVDEFSGLREAITVLKPGGRLRLQAQLNANGEVTITHLDGLSLVAREVTLTGRPVVVTLQQDRDGEIRYSSTDLKLPDGFQLAQLVSRPEFARRLEAGEPVRIQATKDDHGAVHIDWVDP